MLRRGGNVVFVASPGAGLVAAFGLGLADRLASAEPAEPTAGQPSLLVLTPTDDAAAALALSLARFGRTVGLGFRALAPGFSFTGSTAGVVATPAAALDAVRGSRLKLGSVRAAVFYGLDLMLDLAQVDALEAVAASLPKEAQRVATLARGATAADDFIERHVRRAVRVPPQPAELRRPLATSVAGPAIAYALVEEQDRAAAIAESLALDPAPAIIYCRTVPEADGLSEELGLRGIAAAVEGGENGPPFLLAPPSTTSPVDGRRAISNGPPFDSDTLADRHANGGLVLAAPRELAHLRAIAAVAGLPLAFFQLPSEALESRGIEAFRASVRRALAEEDIEVQLLLLAPLFVENSPAEVAGALGALLRARRAAEAPAPEPGEAVPATRTAPAPPAWTRLYVSLGGRDHVGPGDLVGAMTGEAGITGDCVGKIEVRDNFSIVEVRSDVAEKVIAALNGTTVRSRSVRVDYDRRGAGGPGHPGGRGPRGPRRTSSH
jgi:ATP-dependent RNA helicase DeaD